MKKIIRSGITVFVFAVIGVILLSWVYSFTKPKIEEQRILSIKNAIEEIFPNQKGVKELDNFKDIQLQNNVNIKTVYLVEIEDNKNAYVFRVVFSGYGGKVEGIVGFEDDKCKGYYIIEHSETPGLGSKITSEEFSKQFINKSLSDPFIVKQDIQGITGATISSKAITQAIKIVGDYYLKSILGR